MSLHQARSPKGQDSKTIRVSRSVYDQLSALSEEQRASIGDVVADLVNERERQDFYTQMKEGYAALRSDETAWKEFQEELALWDVTLNDGLKDL